MRDAPACRHDRPIAGAAAQIAGERLVHDGVFGWLAAVVEGKHRHHETRCAESALGGIGINEGLLHRMQRTVRRRHPFNREDCAIIDLRQHHQARIHRLEPQRAVHAPPQHDGAGAAIAFCATLLRPREPGAGAKPVEHGHARRRAILAEWLSVQQESHRGHGLPAPTCLRMLEHLVCRLKHRRQFTASCNRPR